MTRSMLNTLPSVPAVSATSKFSSRVSSNEADVIQYKWYLPTSEDCTTTVGAGNDCLRCSMISGT